MRSYAEECALSAVTTRAWSELRDLLETGIPVLIERLRTQKGTDSADLQRRLNAALGFCEQIFGHQYTQVQRKAVEVALQAAHATADNNQVQRA
jgi:hypothetical protein